MAILLNNNCDAGNSDWEKVLPQHLPNMPIYTYPNIPNPDEILYALVWNHPKGDLKNYPNLRCVLSLAAGMEHLLDDPDLPDVPLVSLGDPMMSIEMANYALYWTINAHRHFDQYRIQQANKYWLRLDTVPVNEFKVLVLGLGRIAMTVAQSVQAAGFSVDAWDFKEKHADNIKTHHGKEALPKLLKNVDVVICCLALNNRSKHLINAEFLEQMSRHSHLVNISRGDIVDEDALLHALDKLKISSAALDVLSVEPLPKEHPLWRHPRVSITPHMAGPTPVGSAATIIAANIQRMENGLAPEPVFDPSRGLQS